MPGSTFLSADQVLLTTLVFKLAVMAASATILVRFRRCRHFLISEHRPSRERLTFAVSLGILLSAGVAARLLLGYSAADLTLEGAFLAGLIDGPYAGVTVGALVGLPALGAGEWIALPFAIGCGFAGVAAGRGTTQRHRGIALAIFGSVGAAVELPERHLNALTAVSGSGPAYVFFLVDAWERAAARLGLPPAVAARAIRSTLSGSARLLALNESPAELIRKVASKRGTTEAALTVLTRRRVAAHVIEALRAAARRARELSWD